MNNQNKLHDCDVYSSWSLVSERGRDASLNRLKIIIFFCKVDSNFSTLRWSTNYFIGLYLSKSLSYIKIVYIRSFTILFQSNPNTAANFQNNWYRVRRRFQLSTQNVYIKNNWYKWQIQLFLLLQFASSTTIFSDTFFQGKLFNVKECTKMKAASHSISVAL